MRTRIILIAKSFFCMLLVLIITSSISYSASSQINKSATMSAENQSGFDKGNNSCDIIACIGEIKDACEMKIEVMVNPGPALKSNIDEKYSKELSKVINIKFLSDWPDANSTKKPCLHKDDMTSYKIYKDKDQSYDVSHYSALFKVSKKMSLEQKVGDCSFTYDDLFQAAENLVRRDTAKLGTESLLVKSRSFIQMPLQTFIESTIVKEPY